MITLSAIKSPKCGAALRAIAVLLLVSPSAHALEPTPLDGLGYVLFTLGITAVVLFSAVIVLQRNFRWLTYSVHAALLLLLGSSLDGTLAWALNRGPEFMGWSPLIIGSLANSFGWIHTAVHLQAPHPFQRLRTAFLGFAGVALLIIPAYFIIDSWIPLYAALNTLMLLMIASSVLPPLTWQGLNRFEHFMAIALPLLFSLMVLTLYGAHFLGDGFERETLNAFNRVFGFVYLGYALGFALYYMVQRNRQARESQQRADQAAREAAETALALTEARQDFERAQTLARERSRQLAEASHDIRQPIAALRRAADDLKTRGRSRDTEHIVKAAEYLDDLARSYLAANDQDPSAGGELVRDADGLESVNSTVLSEAVVKLHELEAQSQQVTLRASDEGYLLSVQPLALVRLLSNLVGNALTHARATNVEVRTQSDTSRVRFTVVDDGVGMTAEQLESVVVQGNKGEDSPGHGLGLAIVSSLAAQHDWNFELASQPGHGTRATLSVPSAK